MKHKKFQFLSSLMVQTGFQPPIAITADLATFRLSCRHFMACIACIPDSLSLLQVVYLDQPPIGPRSGRDLARQWKTVLEESTIIPAQIESTVEDGAYHHDNVPKYLEEELEVPEGQIHHAWDHMHKSALEDGHIAKMLDFKWVGKTVDTVTDLVGMFRVGKKHFLLQEICERLDIRLAHLTTLPETRMANYKCIVLKNFDIDLQPIILGLEKIQLEKCGGNKKDREEADNAAAFRAQIYNKKFVLRLTGLCDVYNVYGNIANILQKVNTLPYEKFDLFHKLLTKLRNMIKSVDLSECPTCSQTITSSVTETEVIIPTETSSVDLTNPSSHPSESETSEDPRPKDFDSGDEENESVASDSETFVDIDVILEDNCNSEEVDKEENNKCHGSPAS